MSKIKHISQTSPFYGKLAVGDELVSINGHAVNDVLDYMYYSAADRINITVNRGVSAVSFMARNSSGNLGIDFESYLMDKQRSCRNKCVFCFIDQLPDKMRDTLYYKDDDFRLSLIYGNYVTLTNLSKTDLDRICEMRISPLNISVHATDGTVRARMMKNPNAANILSLLERLSGAGINMRCQIVLCKGFNDGSVLEKSLCDLERLYPSISSVSIVPVGLTKHRDGLEPLELFTPSECSDVIDMIDAHGNECFNRYGNRLFYPADEFYIKSGRALPEEEYYGDFEQLENGVGMLSSFISEFDEAIADTDSSRLPFSFSSVSGEIMRTILPAQLEKLKKVLTGMEYDIHFIRNDTFGADITVTGLICGADVIAQLRDTPHSNILLIPDVMLRDDKFLDDVTLGDVEKALNVKAVAIPCDAAGTVDAICSLQKKN